MSTDPMSTAPGLHAPRRRRVGLVIGLTAIVAGVVGGIVLLIAQRQAYRDAIGQLPRAASGLETEFIFEKEGIFTLYYEYQGSFVADVGGEERDIELDARDTPRRVEATLRDADGDEVRLLRDVPDVSYDVEGRAGVVYKQVRIRDTGRYTLEVGEQRDQFAIAVGAGLIEEPSPVAALAVAAAGIVVGLLALILLGRRSSPALAPPPPLGAPTAWPSTPPGYGSVPMAGAGWASPPVTPGPWTAPPPAPSSAGVPEQPPPPAWPPAPGPGALTGFSEPTSGAADLPPAPRPDPPEPEPGASGHWPPPPPAL
jgi:hypothetical protein